MAHVSEELRFRAVGGNRTFSRIPKFLVNSLTLSDVENSGNKHRLVAQTRSFETYFDRIL
jgi:hypothetical protein